MTKREIIKYLKDKSLFNNPKIVNLGKGTNNRTFLIKENNKKFVLRMARKDVATRNKLRNEFFVLKFLEQKGINFIQRPIFFDSKKLISILTYVPGKEVAISGLNNKQLKIFILHIVKLHALKYKKYKAFCKKNKVRCILIKTPWENIKEYGIKRFEYIKKNCSDKYLINWIKSRLQENIDYIKNTKWTLNKIIFNHNDLAGSNIIVNKKDLYFIDWEHASFVYNTGVGIGVRHIQNYDHDCTEKIIQKLIALYAKRSGQSIKILKEKMDKNAKVDKVNDVIWAAMTFTKLKKKKDNKWKKYKKLTYQRKKEYEEVFES